MRSSIARRFATICSEPGPCNGRRPNYGKEQGSKRRISAGAALAALAIVGTAAYFAAATPTQEPQESDPVTASFDRALSHEPGAAAPVRRESIDHDELYEALNSAHWSYDDTVTGTDAKPTNKTGGTDDEKDER